MRLRQRTFGAGLFLNQRPGQITMKELSPLYWLQHLAGQHCNIQAYHKGAVLEYDQLLTSDSDIHKWLQPQLVVWVYQVVRDNALVFSGHTSIWEVAQADNHLLSSFTSEQVSCITIINLHQEVLNRYKLEKVDWLPVTLVLMAKRLEWEKQIITFNFCWRPNEKPLKGGFVWISFCRWELWSCCHYLCCLRCLHLACLPLNQSWS